jgi:hypothetical protein
MPKGPINVSPNDMFDDLDEQGEHLLSSLHLGPAEEEPARRGGAASRANSVRFDESALQGSSWTGQNSRHSGEFVPIRPGSGMMMERSLSHKSDGRHSSAGHSVHSIHSVASGRASSLGLDATFMVGSHEDDSPIDIPEPPPGFFILGSVPSIIRCWLTTNFAHNTLLYADVCTGSQKTTVDFSLLKELDMLEDLNRDVDGIYRIRLPVYLAEAIVTQPNSRSASPAHQLPSITATFEVVGIDQVESVDSKRAIRVFLGSDTLRAHSADLLFSQNQMVLYGNERDKLAVPFVRPEDDGLFKHLCTTNVVPEKPKLNANAAPFISSDPRLQDSPAQDPVDPVISALQSDEIDSQEALSPLTNHSGPNKSVGASNLSESGGENERLAKDASGSESGSKDHSVGGAASATAESNRRESSTGIWASWRHGGSANGSENGSRENGLLSGYQPAGRGSRSMKVLKPQKSGSSSSARTGASYEPAPPPRSSGEHRRKSQASAAGENGTVRWESKRSLSTSGESKPQTFQREATRNATPSLPRSANPVGGASAFSWMNPASKSKSQAAGTEHDMDSS